MISNYSLRYTSSKKLSFFKSKLHLKKNDVLIEVKSCGMCGSDLKIFNGLNNRVKKNRVIGHEISGKIINSPKNQNFFQINHNIVLGADIENKLNKDFALGHEIDGGFQKYLKINYQLLQKVPHYTTKKKINYNLASLAEPLACCINGIEQIDFKPNHDVLIFGAGPIGQLIAKLCVYFKSNQVFLVDKNKYKLRRGIKDKKIKRLTFNQLKKKINNRNKLEKIKFLFVACSSIEAQKQAIEFAGNDSSINLFAGLRKLNKLDPLLPINTNNVHYKQLKIVGSHGSKFRHLRKAADLLINKKIKLNNIITHVFDLKDYKKAFQKLISGNSLKIIIKPD
jgi:L-iditol 2-dehydrogenase